MTELWKHARRAIGVSEETGKKCELCGWEGPPFERHNGRVLCVQCYAGEAENPGQSLLLAY